MGQKPEKKFKAGAFTASIFSNDYEKNGRKFTIKNVSLQKAYKKNEDDEEWQHQNIKIDRDDIPKAQLCLQKAQEYLLTNPISSDESEE